MSDDTIGKLAMLCVILLLGSLCWWSPPFGDDSKYKAFMTECQNDAFKRYQCEAMWRGSYAILDIPAVRNGLK